MALSTPSASPAVVVKEIDLTGGVPNVQSTTGAIVGNFRWGPAEQRVLIDNDTKLVDTFASPDSANTIDFHSASYFLRYSGSLQVVREVTSAAKNARSTIGQLGTDTNNTLPTPTVKNADDFAAQDASLDSDSHTLIARYPVILVTRLKYTYVHLEILHSLLGHIKTNLILHQAHHHMPQLVRHQMTKFTL